MEEIPPNLARSGAIEIAEKLKLISGGKILDIATGDGGSLQFLIDFLKDYETAIGIDNDENELKKSQERFKEKPVVLKVMNGEKLDFPDNTFDLVSMAFSMHHLQKLFETLNEMKRVLKNGGYIMIQEMFSDAYQTDAQKNDTAVHEFGAEIDRMEGKYHRKEYTKDEILNILSQVELKDLEIFESSKYVKCLRCEERYDCDDPKHPPTIKSTLEDIDKALESIKEHKKYSDLKERAETIKQKIKKHGIASTSILFCIGRK